MHLTRIAHQGIVKLEKLFITRTSDARAPIIFYNVAPYVLLMHRVRCQRIFFYVRVITRKERCRLRH